MRTLFLFAFVTFIFACSSGAPESSSVAVSSVPTGPSEKPEIHIEVEGLQAGPAFLIATFTDQRFRLDSTQVDATGKMTFKNDTPYPSGLLFVYLPNKAAFQMMVDQDQTFTMKTKVNDLNGFMEVEGSIDNQLLYRSIKFEADQKPKFEALSAQIRSAENGSMEYHNAKAAQDKLVQERKAFLDEIFTQYPSSLFTKFKIAGQNPDPINVYKADGKTMDTSRQVYLYRTKFWEGVDFQDERLLRTPVIANKLKRYITELTPQNADSINAATKFLVDQLPLGSEYFKYITNYIALYYDPGKTPVMDPNAIFVFIAQNYFTQDKAFWTDSIQVAAIQKRAAEQQNSLVGGKGPDVKAKDPTGKLRSIYEIKSPYIIVYMYNPECEHCIEETPQLVRFYREWKPKGVEVFGIAIETDEAKWKNFVAKNGMDWINVFDPTNRAIYATYFVDNTPELYVLDPDRTIIAKNLKPSQVAEVIERDMRKKGK
ncbi:MAG: redoxin domain-containing protein [Saprospirales bacterium]|nr:redoxin domain-containing protein [Saprospirales bacterium]